MSLRAITNKCLETAVNGIQSDLLYLSSLKHQNSWEEPIKIRNMRRKIFLHTPVQEVAVCTKR